METKKLFRYHTTQRPPMPGAVPRMGLKNVVSYDTRIMHPIWGFYTLGYVEYDRQLSASEISNYELEFDPED